MPCRPIIVKGFATGFICSRTKAPRCACGKPSEYQCDAPTARKSGTCDRHLCASCATQTGPDTHLCPDHANGPAQPSLEF